MQVFKVAALFIIVLISFVSCTSGEVKECETIFDCPEGYMCDEYFQCVLINDKNDNNSSTDNETVPDENDNTVLPDSGQPDENEPVDNNVTPDENDETVIPDEEEDDDFQHDEDFMDEDMIDEDFIDEDLTDSDEDVVDEDFADEDTNDEDSVIIPESVTIGEGTDTQWMPIGCRYFKYSRSAALYLSSEIGVSAPITKIGWFDNTGAGTSRPVIIYLKETSAVSGTSDVWLTQTSGAAEVFNGETTTAYGWNEFTLITPFNYSGTDNLLVLVEMNEGSFCSSDEPAMRYSVAPSMHSSLQTDSDTTGYLSVGDNRPNIKLFF
jgi:hypothetical protein